MDNPFPGMNPYLERRWGGVHTTMAVYVADGLNELLPDDLIARVKETELIADGVDGSRKGHRGKSINELATQRHIEIFDVNNEHSLVTAIEFLCLENKNSVQGQLAYLRRVTAYADAGANLVEIDLTRGGAFVMALESHRIPENCRTPYLISVRRASRPTEARLFSIPLAAPLPILGIPLRPTDLDVVLQLQPLLNDCYRKGRYSSIDYTKRLDPPLDKADAAWADELLRSKGLGP